MIAFIEGTLSDISSDHIVVETGGVGYEILTYAYVISRLPGLGEDVKIITYLDVKEDSMRLFGFLSYQEKTLFTQLISVSGVGPKGALSILNELGPDALVAAIISGDSKSISKANGIGAKTAQKVVLELRDKVSLEGSIFEADDIPAGADVNDSEMDDVLEALTVLGYTRTEALKAVRKVKDAGNMETGKLIKAALEFL